MEDPPEASLHDPSALDLERAPELVDAPTTGVEDLSGARELSVDDLCVDDLSVERGEDALGPLLLTDDEDGSGLAGVDAEASSGREDRAASAVPSLPRFAGIKVREAVPVALSEQGLTLELDGGRNVVLAYRKIQAVAVSAVHGLSEHPVLIVDLIANWNDANEGPLRLVRLRSDRFDPVRLVPGTERPAEAIRELRSRLLARSGAVSLPDPDGATGGPFRVFESLEVYQRDVLQADL